MSRLRKDDEDMNEKERDEHRKKSQDQRLAIRISKTREVIELLRGMEAQEQRSVLDAVEILFHITRGQLELR